MKSKTLLIQVVGILLIATSCDRAGSGPTSASSEQKPPKSPEANLSLPVARICSTALPRDFISAASNLQTIHTNTIVNFGVAGSARQIRGAELKSEKVQLALLKSYVWRDANSQVRHDLKVRFLSGDIDVQQRIKKVAQIWSTVVNMKLNFTDSGDADIRIGISNDGFSWSKVGNQSAEAKDGETMHYGWLDRATPDAEYQRTVLHEFGHALGAVHEHQSPGGVINWNIDAVHAWCASNIPPWSTEDCDFNIINRYSPDQAIYTRLDPSSIMVYSFPASWTTDGTSMPMNWRLSNDDKSLMSSMYGPPKQ